MSDKDCKTTRDDAHWGLNRTGVAGAPSAAPMLLYGGAVPPLAAEATGAQALRREYISSSVSLGTNPPALSMRQWQDGGERASAALSEVLIDKLAERLAGERLAVRLCEHFLNRCLATPETLPPAATERLQLIAGEKLDHFEVLSHYLQLIGADATAMTPGGDVFGMATNGLSQLMMEPRASLEQSLQALLLLNLINQEGWLQLLRIGEGRGLSMTELLQAQQRDADHLQSLRGMTEQALHGQLGQLHS